MEEATIAIKDSLMCTLRSVGSLFFCFLLTSCTSSTCHVSLEDAERIPSMLRSDTRDANTLFRVEGVYKGDWESSKLAAEFEGSLLEVPHVYYLDFCVEVHPRCAGRFYSATRIPEGISPRYLHLAKVDVIVEYDSSDTATDCPLGTVTVEHIVSVNAHP